MSLRRAHTLLVWLAVWAAPMVYASDPAPRAIENEPRIWRALSGDMLELDGTIYRLHGVRCPDMGEKDGRDAKALLNTFLRGGEIACRVWQSPEGPHATCNKEGRDVATGLIKSGLCRPYLTGPRQEATRTDPLGVADVLRLGSASRDRRQFTENLCNPRSVDTKPSAAFFNRCTEEVIRNAVDAIVQNQLDPDGSGLTRRDPFPFSAFSQ